MFRDCREGRLKSRTRLGRGVYLAFSFNHDDSLMKNGWMIQVIKEEKSNYMHTKIGKKLLQIWCGPSGSTSIESGVTDDMGLESQFARRQTGLVECKQAIRERKLDA